MSPPSWLTDTIARRFVLTQILLVGATVAMACLLIRVGGFWAEEPLERSPLLRGMIVTARLIDAVPAPLRPSLASAATSGSSRAYWFGADSPVVPFLEAQGYADEPSAQLIRAALHRRTIVLRVSHSTALPSGFPPNPGGLYGWLLAVRLRDGSWLAFFRDDAVTETTTHFDLPQMLMTIVNDCADRHIELCYDGPAHAVYKGRPLALKRAVSNLVENALKYATPPSLELLREAGAYVVVIRDRGPGIPEDALENVFLPYYRVEKSRNRNTGGVGLGLTVVRTIVQGHGGEVMLKNSPSGGLEARVLLPVEWRRTHV